MEKFSKKVWRSFVSFIDHPQALDLSSHVSDWYVCSKQYLCSEVPLGLVLCFCCHFWHENISKYICLFMVWHECDVLCTERDSLNQCRCHRQLLKIMNCFFTVRNDKWYFSLFYFFQKYKHICTCGWWIEFYTRPADKEKHKKFLYYMVHYGIFVFVLLSKWF